MRIFILGTLGYFALGVLPEGRGGHSHIFRRLFRSCSKIFESGSGSEKFSPLRIWLLFRLRLSSM